MLRSLILRSTADKMHNKIKNETCRRIFSIVLFTSKSLLHSLITKMYFIFQVYLLFVAPPCPFIFFMSFFPIIKNICKKCLIVMELRSKNDNCVEFVFFLNPA